MACERNAKVVSLLFSSVSLKGRASVDRRSTLHGDEDGQGNIFIARSVTAVFVLMVRPPDTGSELKSQPEVYVCRHRDRTAGIPCPF